MDEPRQLTEIEIRRCETTSRMLNHLARAVEEGPTSRRSRAYPSDAIEALLHGSEIAQARADNLRHCAELYDEWLAIPVPDPSEATA